MGDPALLALRQFAAHRGLRASVTDVCLWSAYTSTLLRRTLDYALLHPLLQRIHKSGIDSGHPNSQVPSSSTNQIWIQILNWLSFFPLDGRSEKRLLDSGRGLHHRGAHFHPLHPQQRPTPLQSRPTRCFVKVSQTRLNFKPLFVKQWIATKFPTN